MNVAYLLKILLDINCFVLKQNWIRKLARGISISTFAYGLASLTINLRCFREKLVVFHTNNLLPILKIRDAFRQTPQAQNNMKYREEDLNLSLIIPQREEVIRIIYLLFSLWNHANVSNTISRIVNTRRRSVYSFKFRSLYGRDFSEACRLCLYITHTRIF